MGITKKKSKVDLEQKAAASRSLPMALNVARSYKRKKMAKGGEVKGAQNTRAPAVPARKPDDFRIPEREYMSVNWSEGNPPPRKPDDRRRPMEAYMGDNWSDNKKPSRQPFADGGIVEDIMNRRAKRMAEGGEVEDDEDSDTSTETSTGGSSPGGASTGGVGSGIGGAGTGGAATGGASTGGAGTVNVTLSGDSGAKGGKDSKGGKKKQPVNINISNVGGQTDAGSTTSGDGPGSSGTGGSGEGSGGGGGGAAPGEPEGMSKRKNLSKGGIVEDIMARRAQRMAHGGVAGTHDTQNPGTPRRKPDDHRFPESEYMSVNWSEGNPPKRKPDDYRIPEDEYLSEDHNFADGGEVRSRRLDFDNQGQGYELDMIDMREDHPRLNEDEVEDSLNEDEEHKENYAFGGEANHPSYDRQNMIAGSHENENMSLEDEDLSLSDIIYSRMLAKRKRARK